MKILSVRKGFQADHSSTSYEFFAVDKALDPISRKAVAKLSSRARPTKRRVSFIYNGEWSDLPCGWEPLMRKYYDVMYSESYDWWTLAVAFNTNQDVIEKIKKHQFRGSDDMGVEVHSKEDRIVVSISCRLSADAMGTDEYLGYDVEEDDGEADSLETNDNLLDLLVENRKYLQKGDCRLLYGIFEKYGKDSEEVKKEEPKNIPPPEPSSMIILPKPMKHLLSLLEKI